MSSDNSGVSYFKFKNKSRHTYEGKRNATVFQMRTVHKKNVWKNAQKKRKKSSASVREKRVKFLLYDFKLYITLFCIC